MRGLLSVVINLFVNWPAHRQIRFQVAKVVSKCANSLWIFQRGLLETSEVEFNDVVGEVNPYFRIRKSSLVFSGGIQVKVR